MLKYGVFCWFWDILFILWNYVNFGIICCNLGYSVDFGKLCWFWFYNLIDTAYIMSHEGDAGGDPPHPSGSQLPGQCESCKYYDSYTFVLF